MIIWIVYLHFYINLLSSSHLEVNGSKIYYDYYQAGPKVVVFEAGAKAHSELWRLVTPKLRKEGISYLIYDRPGLGRSEVSKVTRTGIQTAKDLHELTEGLNIKKPIVLVGHSMGGVYSQIYTSLFPENVSAIILVDVPHYSWESELLKCLTEEQGEKRAQDLKYIKSNSNLNIREESDDAEYSFLYLKNMPSPSCKVQVLMGENQQWPENYNEDCLSSAWRCSQLMHLEDIPNASLTSSDIAGHQLPLEDPEKIIFLIRKVLKD